MPVSKPRSSRRSLFYVLLGLSILAGAFFVYGFVLSVHQMNNVTEAGGVVRYDSFCIPQNSGGQLMRNAALPFLALVVVTLIFAPRPPATPVDPT